MKTAAVLLCALLALARPAAGEQSLRIERLAGLARVWGFAKYFHPALAARPDLDWDAALVAAIPRVREARTADEYAAAVGGMLGLLGDPLTRVRPEPRAPSPDRDRPFDFRWTPEKVLVVTAGDYYALGGVPARQKLADLAAAVPAARAVVFDLRPARPVDAFGRMQLAASFDDLQRLLATETLAVPGERRRVYYGFESPSPFSSGQYRTGYFVRAVPPVVPAKNARAVPSVFLVDERAAVLPATIPLQAAGRALVVYEGDLRRHTVGDTAAVPLADGLVAEVRQSEPVFADGTSADFRPDVVVPTPAPGAGDPALERAVALAAAFEPSRVVREMLPATAALPRERAYPEMRYPSVEHRLLAAMRLWNAVEYFYPYHDLLDRDWDEALAEALPVFEAARDAREYSLAVAAMAVRIQDSHAYVSGPVFSEEVVGTGYPPIRVRMIEGLPVVAHLVDEEAARRAGVEVGDVIVSVDGRPAAERLEETARSLSTSTPQSREDRASLTFMNGSVGSSVTLVLRDAAGREKRAALERRREDYTTLYHRERRGEVVRVLSGNVGYVDLDRLTYDMVEPMFERLKDTRAIVFDMRGYPHGTVWAIAPRLADAPRVVAVFETPLVGHGSQAARASELFRQTLEPAASGRYRGRTVMLVDERTVSQAEHTGLYLRAANGTVFVGSATAGANGEITSVALPGGIGVGFTGQAVRWPDGRQLQRVGLRPDVEVKPTLAGIRAGRDEVLEAALRVLGGR